MVFSLFHSVGYKNHSVGAAVARPVDQGVLGRAPLPAPPQQLKGGKSPRLLKQPRHQAPIQCVESQIARNDPARRAAQDELVGSLLQHQGDRHGWCYLFSRAILCYTRTDAKTKQ